MAMLSTCCLKERNIAFFVLIVLAASLELACAESRSIRSRIYYDIDTYGVCFQRANATHQIGCASSPAGNVGTVQLVQNSKNLTWLLTNGPQDPYVAALADEMFTFDALKKLNSSKKIAGVLLLRPFVLWNKSKPNADTFSPDAKCPNAAQAKNFYSFLNNTEFGQCKARTNSTINPDGQDILHNFWRFPIFAVRLPEHIDFIVNNCYMKYNSPPTESSLPDYPLCQAELRSFMYSATGSKRCVARAQLVQNPLNPNRPLCDPIALNSVYTFLNPVVQPTVVQRKSVILVVARMDVMPLFTDSYEGTHSPRASGADTTISGLVTLLMIANALAKSAADFRHKSVIFAALNGETLDYMGSVRLAYDMQNGTFPGRISTNYSSINFDAIDFVVDVGQVGSTTNGNKLFVHSEVLSRGQSAVVDNRVKEILKSLKDQSSGDIEVLEASGKRGLPPSSLHPLFKADRSLAGILLADYDNQYTNRYYMSEFDTLENVNGSYAADSTIFDAPTEFAKRISNVATTVARAIYQLAASDNLMVPTSVVADVGLTNQLIYCYAFRCNCSLFQNFSSPSQAMSCGIRSDDDIHHAEARPVPLYQGPEQYQTSEVTFRTAQTMFYAAGVPINIPVSQCRGIMNASNLLWLENVENPFNGRATSGVCYKSNSFLSMGMSPAFELDDYSGTFPTWTESRWGSDVTLRLFLKPSPIEEIATLLIGVIVTVLSFLLVYFINRNARTLFALHDDEPVVVTTATTTTTTQIRHGALAASATPVAPAIGTEEDLDVVVVTKTSTAHE